LREGRRRCAYHRGHDEEAAVRAGNAVSVHMRRGFYGGCWALALLAAPAHAQSLVQAWRMAQAQEPTVQAARATAVAAAERGNQAFAQLLPQVSATLSANSNKRVYQQGAAFTGPEVSEKYDARNHQINLTQPLWRPANLFGHFQARHAAAQSALQAAAAEQDLAARFLTAWFDAMAARDSVTHAGEQVLATAQQVQVFTRAVQLGAASDVQLSDARARHQQALAEALAAQADIEAKQAALEQLTGTLPAFAPPRLLGALDKPLAGDPGPVAGWLARAAGQSPAVLAAVEALSAAQEEVRKQKAQATPTVDLVANRNFARQGSGTTPGQAGFKSQQDSVGLQVNVPLFAGGGNMAKIREAIALAEKAEHELEAAKRQAAFQVRQAWAAARAASGRIAAGTEAITAASTALRAATVGEGTGLKTRLDELQARQQLALARRDQLRAHYDALTAFGRLKAASGMLDDAAFAQLDALTQPAR
jgi:outer membrane protein